MSNRKALSSSLIKPHNRQHYRIENDKCTMDLIKRGDRTLSTLSFCFEAESNSLRKRMLKKTSTLLKRIKYCRYISIEKDLVSKETYISKMLKYLRRCTSTRKLRLICQNNVMEDRVNSYSSFRLLRRMNRLDTAIFNIFFNPIRQNLFTKFGSIIHLMNIKSLVIKEPLTFASDRLTRRFQIRTRRVIPHLKSLGLTAFAPVEGPIERYTPFKLTKNAVNLHELSLTFIGVCLNNKSLRSLLSTIRGMKSLKALSLDLSFNKISDLEDFNQLKGLSLKHLHLNFSYCPLVDDSISYISSLIKGSPGLSSVEVILNSVNISQSDVFQLSGALGSLKELENVGVSLNEIKTLDTRSLLRFLNQFLKSTFLVKVNLSLSQALCMGMHPDLNITPLRSANLRYLQLNLSGNRIRNTEVSYIIDFFKFCTGIEHLKLCLDSCKLNGKTGELIWKWVCSLENLKYLEMSIRSTDISEACISGLLKGLTKLKIQELKLDITDTYGSLYSAKDIWGSILNMKRIKSLLLISSYIGFILPSNHRDILRKKLPECIRYEIC